MALVDMNAVHFYQPGEAASRCEVGRQAVSSSRVSMARRKGNNLPALGPDEEWSGTFPDNNPIRIIGVTGLLPEKPFNLFQRQARDLYSTEKDVEETSNGLNTSGTYGRYGVENVDNLPDIEELLFGASNGQDWWQSTGSSDRQVTGGSKGNLENAVKNDGNIVANPGSSEGENEKKSVPIGDSCLKDRNTQDAQQEANSSIHVQTYHNLTPDGKDKEKEAVHPDKSIGSHGHDTRTHDFTALRKQKPAFKIPPTLHPNDWDSHANSSRNEPGSPGDPVVVQDQDIDNSSDGASEEQDRNQGSLSTPLTSVAGSDAGKGLKYILDEPNTDRSRRSRYSTFDQQNKHDTPYTSPNRNIPLSTPGKRTRRAKGENPEGLTPDPSTDRDKKVPCSDQEAEVDDKKEDGEKYIGDSGEKTTPLGFTKKRSSSTVEGKAALKRLAKHRRCSPPSPAVQNQAATSPLPLEQAQEHGDKSQVEGPEWEIEKILAKRKTSSSKYKVRWKDTWLPKSELGNARELLQEFEARIYKV